MRSPVQAMQQETNPVTHVTTYRGMVLTPYHYGDPNDPQRNGVGYGYNRRTRRIFHYIGRCIDQGGSVFMETWYDGPILRADIRLEWVR